MLHSNRTIAPAKPGGLTAILIVAALVSSASAQTHALTADGVSHLTAASEARFVIADWDVDGDMDVLVEGRWTSEVFENDGLGTFTGTGSAAWVHNGDVIQGARWADVNGDGLIDQVGLYCVPNSFCGDMRLVTRLRGPGGAWLPSTHGSVNLAAPTAGRIALNDLKCDDVDGDGFMDLVAWTSGAALTNGVIYLYVLWGDGTGAPDGFTLDTNFLVTQSNGFPGMPVDDQQVFLRDFDGDSDLDVGYYSTKGWGWVENLGARSFASTPWSSTVPLNNQLIPGVEDVTGDGLPDFVFVQEAYYPTGSLDVFPSAGSAGIAPPLYSAGAAPGFSQGAALFDFDGDGDLDVARSRTDLGAPTVEVSVNGGSGNYAAVSPGYQFAGGVGHGHLDAADFDGDGDTDILSWTTGQTGSFTIFRTAPLANVPYPGSQDGLLLQVGVDTTPSTTFIQPVAGPGVVDVLLTSPSGYYATAPVVIVGDAWTTGNPNPPLYTDIYFGITGIVLYESLGAFGLAGILGSGVQMSLGVDAATHAALNGQSVMLQAVAITALASNGFFASSGGIELQF